MRSIDLLGHLEKLRGFAAVAKLGGFHKASRELAISQPALSRSIDSLESILGEKLLVRLAKGSRLTAEGELVLSFYEKIESSAGDLVQKINSGNVPFAGEIRVASYEELCVYFWAGFLKAFTVKYPALKVILTTANEDEYWRKLSSGVIDALVDVEPKVSHDWDSIVLYSDRYGFFASKDYEIPPGPLNLISVEKASDEKGLTIRDHCVMNGLSFNEIYKFDSFLSVQAFVLKGLGIGALPEKVAQEDLRQGKLKRVSVSGFSKRSFGRHRICLSILGQNAKDSRLCLFKRELKTYLSQMVR